MYTYIHSYLHKYIHTYIHSYMHTYKHTAKRTAKLHCQFRTLTPACQVWRHRVCTIFLVFGMTRKWCEPTTYHMRGGHN